jgi:glutamate 5-kinase
MLSDVEGMLDRPPRSPVRSSSGVVEDPDDVDLERIGGSGSVVGSGGCARRSVPRRSPCAAACTS